MEEDIVIYDKNYYSVGNELREKGICEYYVECGNFLYHTNNSETMQPVERYSYDYYLKNSIGKNVLYICRIPCKHIYIMATEMKKNGYSVFLLYLDENCDIKEYVNIFEKSYVFTSMNGILDFVKNSEFDLVHCYCEYNILTNILKSTGKPVINDYILDDNVLKDLQMDSIVLDYMANKYSAGNIYSSNSIKELVKSKFDINEKLVCIISDSMIECGDFYKELNAFYDTVKENFANGINAEIL